MALTASLKTHSLVRGVLLALLSVISFSGFSQVQLDENCVVSVLNRTVQVKPDGTWVLPNIPANFGPVRARATCVENGVTTSGESALFTIPANGSVDVPPINLGSATSIPSSVVLTAASTTLTQPNETTQLTVTAQYPSGTTSDITLGSTGTQYLISNPALASVSADGLVTAKESGTVLVQAVNEGTQGLLLLSIALSQDSDGDGIPDDIEISLGLDPTNPADALDDLDRDGLTNKDELQYGTGIRNPDSDGDGILDGEEVIAGLDGFITNPLLADTDNDGVPDNIEVASGSDPTNSASTNLANALKQITVTPKNFVINVNTIDPLAFQQLTLTGEFNLGGTIDLTPLARGTNYASSDLNVCNFGAQDGRVFGGIDGTCVITATNNGFSATATGTVRTFTPLALSQIAIPGYANNVDASGSFAYVAAGATGLQVVSVSDPANPQIVGSADTQGNANDVRLVGNLAFVADGSFGLQIFDVTDPTNPILAGALDTAGDASDVIVSSGRAYIADGDAGAALIDVNTPTAPSLLKQIDTPGTARGVDVLTAGNGNVYAIVTDDSPSAGLRVIDVTDPPNAAIVANLPLAGSPKDLRVSGDFAYVAAFTGGMQIIDLSNPLSPVAAGSLPNQFVPRDVEVAGNFALFAEQLFPNAVPLVEISDPLNPIFRTAIDFSSLGDYAGTGIAVNGPFFYMTGESFIVSTDNGVIGNTRLFVGQYLPQQDLNGVPPQVSLTAPVDGSTAIQGSNIMLQADATDDVAVAAVTFNVDGVDVFTDTSAPYETFYTIPANSTGLTIEAKAIDLGGNVGTSNLVNITAIPDPLTTATGRVLRDGTLTAISGAMVTCVGQTTTSNLGGGFSISGLSTIGGNISCNATHDDNGIILRGRSSSKAPVPAGNTDVGDIIVRQGSEVLLISDATSNGLNALVQALINAGNQITVRPPPEYTWDNTNPPLTNFGCVIHLDGATPFNGFPDSAQIDMVDFVRNGGGFISSGWLGFEVVSGYSPSMYEIALQGAGFGLGSGSTTYSAIVNHPILAGLPNQFTLQTEGDEAGPIFNYSTNPVLKIMQSSSCCGAGVEAGVYVRDFGAGHVVKFSFMAHWGGQSGDVLADSNAQKLFINAIDWACP